MEFIANLERSHSGEGITPQTLDKIEQIFHNAVGNEKEIDLAGFKKIVQSKNMFFVERMFDVFDTDKSGTISLEEFMYVMRCFANQSPIEKLRYLFDVYDLNNDGSIDFSELRNVISECMKENGLQFGEAETDELTRMLFEDADADGSGTVNFEEFRNQLERQPAFMQNLTLSLERWLLPPMENQRCDPSCKSKWSKEVMWRRLRNNWTNVAYLFVYFLLNLVLFSERAYKYRQSNIYIVLARACGQCLNFNCAFIVVPVLRQTLTWLRTHGYAEYFPIDHHLYYHKLTGCVVFIFSIVHTAMHIGNFNRISSEEGIPLLEILTSTQLNIGWVAGTACLTGWIVLFIVLVMCISAMPFVRRSGKFEVFYCLHLLFFIFWTCLILHGPNFWMWFIGPGILFVIEFSIRINRNLSSSKAAYVQQGVLLPSKVTQLVIKRPPKFDYKPGDYVYLNIPAIAKFEWHPFTISSAPELDDVIWLHIRGVGEWTNRLHDYFQKEDRDAVLSEELAKNIEVLPEFFRSESVTSGDVKNQQETPSGGGSTRNVSLLSVRQRHDVTFTCITPGTDVVEFFNKKGNSLSSAFRQSLDTTTGANSAFGDDSSLANQTVIEMERGDRTFTLMPSVSSYNNAGTMWRRTSFTSTSSSLAVQRKNKEDIRQMLAESNMSPRLDANASKRSVSFLSTKRDKKSVRVSVAKRGLRKCQTVIVMPTVGEEDEDDAKMDLEKDLPSTEEEMKDLKREVDVENVIVRQIPLKIFLDGPYGSPTRHIFQARHAVLIGTGIGVTPYASILQSIMYQYRKSKHTCPSCNHRWSDPLPVSNIHLKKVDFFWLNRHQRSFEWFVSLLSELEVEQAQLEERDRFLDIHMYITSALHPSDMKAVGLQMALDLLYKREKRDLITGLKSRTQPGKPDWNQVFTSIAQQQKGKVTVFFCGPNQLAKTLQSKCDEFGFRFRKEIF